MLLDWIAVVREGFESETIGVSKRKHRGEELVEFCLENSLVIANTRFQYPKQSVVTTQTYILYYGRAFHIKEKKKQTG